MNLMPYHIQTYISLFYLFETTLLFVLMLMFILCPRSTLKYSYCNILCPLQLAHLLKEFKKFFLAFGQVPKDIIGFVDKDLVSTVCIVRLTTDFADKETNSYQQNNLPVPVSYMLVTWCCFGTQSCCLNFHNVLLIYISLW